MKRIIVGWILIILYIGLFSIGYLVTQEGSIELGLLAWIGGGLLFFGYRSRKKQRRLEDDTRKHATTETDK